MSSTWRRAKDDDAEGSVSYRVMPGEGLSDGRSLILPRFGYSNMKKVKHAWYKPRGYVHFDSPLSRTAAEILVTNVDAVAAHAFYPLLRYTVETQKIEKSKSTGLVTYKDPKQRPISFAAHADAHISSYYAFLLTDPYERQLHKTGLDESILAFRALGKSNIQFANDAFEQIKLMGNCVAFATDITGFFDNLDHKHLKKAWADLMGAPSLDVVG